MILVNFDNLLELLNDQITKQQNYPLSPVETIILQGIFYQKTYREIAQEKGYSKGYLTNVVAPQLYQRLSRLLGDPINKKNCLKKLELHLENQIRKNQKTENVFVKVTEKSHTQKFTAYPNIPISVDSPYYVERIKIETEIKEVMQISGGLIILKSPSNMGKTSLILRVLEDSKQKGYQSIYLTLGLVDKKILVDLEKFLRWLCIRVSQELNIEPQLALYWDKDLGNKSSCTQYFENYLLPLIKVPIILAIDEVDRLCENHEVIEDIFSLFRVWQEKSQQLSDWGKFRLILVKSTETLVIKSCNLIIPKIGQEINLGEFEKDEVQRLIQLNQAQIRDVENFEKLIQLLGQNPGLISLTLYHLSLNTVTLEEILQKACTDEGIYQHHLQYYGKILDNFPKLKDGFYQVITPTTTVNLESQMASSLNNLGLIRYRENTIICSCELYRRYFANKL